MTTTFGWKRKRQLFGNSAALFNEEEAGSNDRQPGVDWLAAAKRRKAIFLEDSKAKSKRLQQEGAVLAESERFWEAIRYWDEAINLTPASAVLHEMRSQVRS